LSGCPYRKPKTAFCRVVPQHSGRSDNLQAGDADPLASRGFRSYWRWKSRPQGGRPKTELEIRELIREISIANPFWGAPRIHGELVKLGIDVGQTTVANTTRSAIAMAEWLL
jgi:hypothetical protein